MRQPIEFSGDDSGTLGCEGLSLESAFVEGDAQRATVLVHRVDLSRSQASRQPPALVKFSEDRYAIPRSETLKLATPQYYRDFEGESGGIRDEREAQYREDILSAFAKTNTLSPSILRTLSG
ncbi:MAG: hypothetical protein OXD50_04440 [Chloroflexi bacterium]|nr:hypothetical protein [Chloroflexota bacterium]